VVFVGIVYWRFSWENHRKTIGKPWENHRKTIGKPWENHRNTIGTWIFYPLVSTVRKNYGKIHHAIFSGKSTISTGPFSSSQTANVYQEGNDFDGFG
jgi:hypothetical protein